MCVVCGVAVSEAHGHVGVCDELCNDVSITSG